jgi:2-dehydro-3-deoxygluconokinase
MIARVIADSRPARVVTLGECMASFVARERGPMPETTDFLRTIAGAEANVAVGLSRLGVPVSFIGRVGADGLGTTILRRLRGEGVDVSHLRVDPSATTGVMIRELRDIGPSEVIYWRAGSAGSRLTAVDVEAAGALIDGAEWLHVTGITPALSMDAANAVDAAVARARGAGARISLDINIRLRLWAEAAARSALAPLAARCDLVLGGVEELAVVAGLAETLAAGADVDPGRAADAILALGPEVVVVKLGAAGALERRARGSVSAAAFPVDHVVDPVGAGDAFSAGYIATVLAGGSSADALAAANACGAAAVSTLGDQSGLPTRDELRRLLGSDAADTLR